MVQNVLGVKFGSGIDFMAATVLVDYDDTCDSF